MRLIRKMLYTATAAMTLFVVAACACIGVIRTAYRSFSDTVSEIFGQCIGVIRTA